MALDTYANLKLEIAAWTHRDDLTSYLDTFIDLAESLMNNKLRMSEMETSATVTLTAGAFTLPTGFVEMRDIHVSDTPDTTLEYLPPYLFSIKKQGTETGKPRFYTIYADAGEVYPAGSYDLEMVYYKSLTALDGTNTSNFVLTRFPFLYLHGCLQQAYIFMRDAEGAQLHGSEFERQMLEANKMSRSRKISGAPLRVVAA